MLWRATVWDPLLARKWACAELSPRRTPRQSALRTGAPARRRNGRPSRPWDSRRKDPPAKPTTTKTHIQASQKLRRQLRPPLLVGGAEAPTPADSAGLWSGENSCGRRCCDCCSCTGHRTPCSHGPLCQRSVRSRRPWPLRSLLCAPAVSATGARAPALTRGAHGAWGGGPACGRSIGGRNARSRERCCAAPAAELLGHQSAAALLLRRSGWGDKAQLAVRPKRSRAAIEDARKRIRRGKKVNMSSTDI